MPISTFECNHEFPFSKKKVSLKCIFKFIKLDGFNAIKSNAFFYQINDLNVLKFNNLNVLINNLNDLKGVYYR